MLPLVNVATEHILPGQLLAGARFDLPRDDVAARYARVLLSALGAEVQLGAQARGLSPAQAWQDSGLAAITGPSGGAGLDCPAPLASCADGVMLAIEAVQARTLPWLGRRLLGMRRCSHPLRAGGRVSANGSCRLLATADGDIALNLARPEDWQLLPAWVECEGIDSWSAVTARVATRRRAELLERARWMGLAVAPSLAPSARSWLHAAQLSAGPAKVSTRFKVIDLSALWAGPLCSFLLAGCGAEVLRVEHPQRPDGARLGPTAFFDSLNAGKATCALDLATREGRDTLLALIAEADVVIEGSRPRALRQLGVDAEALVRQHPGLCWLSITGYGRGAPEADWVAFGDDAAVAAGLSQLMRARYGEALFCGDALADPLTGMHAALAVLAARRAGCGGLFSVPLRDVTAHAITAGLNVL
ncbi:MAG: CoA transferase [Oceanococcus sp.]|nr:MAG: CoA transferase [Oceanococcus sp.]